MADAISDQLSAMLRQALADEPSASAGGAPPAGSVPDAAFRWEMPNDPSFGDLSCSLAFKLAARRKHPPHRVADELSGRLLSACQGGSLGAVVDRVEAKAGFLNVFLSLRALARIVQDILSQRDRYGHRAVRPAPSVNIEFVSANPTGPLSVAHGRQAAVGDVLARLLRSQGCQVTTEYYLNDEGRQIELLGRSLRARYLQQLGREEPFPEDGYHGTYVVDSGGRLAKATGDQAAEQPLEYFMELGMKEQLEEIKHVLTRFGLTFDQWTSQQWLRTSGRITQALETLKGREALYESDDALWFASTKYGDDKDRVVRKRDGELTYLAPDIAYHQWKFERGFTRLVNLWGPDHHGYIARIKASVAALGLPADRLMVRIVQLVTLSRHGKPIPMSKRQGEFVTFREILDEIGVDATRFFFLMRTMDSHLDVDLELAKSQSQDNPVYYVQYAHARICSIFANAQPPGASVPAPNLERLTQPEERLLMRTLFQFPIVLQLCAAALEPHAVTGYLRSLAEDFHVFYAKHRVLSDDAELSAARLALIDATRCVLANGLSLLGVTAPTRM